jgi:hypothetical protein
VWIEVVLDQEERDPYIDRPFRHARRPRRRIRIRSVLVKRFASQEMRIPVTHVVESTGLEYQFV